jgi:hypothetical protein
MCLPQWPTQGRIVVTLWVALPLMASIGLIYAGLSTVYIKALSAENPLLAAFFDALVTSCGFIAWSLMQYTGHESSPMGIAAYCLGGAVGTYTIMRRRQKHSVDADVKSSDKDV